MLSYKLPEAQELLKSKLSSAQQNHSNVVEDLEFLREQITIMEVNTARASPRTGIWRSAANRDIYFGIGVQLGRPTTKIEA